MSDSNKKLTVPAVQIAASNKEIELGLLVVEGGVGGKDKLEKEALMEKKVSALDHIKNNNKNTVDKVDGGGGANLASFALTELVKELNSGGDAESSQEKEKNLPAKKKWLLVFLKYAKIFILIAMILVFIKVTVFPSSTSVTNSPDTTDYSSVELSFDKVEKIISLILQLQHNQNVGETGPASVSTSTDTSGKKQENGM